MADKPWLKKNRKKKNVTAAKEDFCCAAPVKPKQARLPAAIVKQECLDMITLVAQDDRSILLPRPCAMHSQFVDAMIGQTEREEEEEEEDQAAAIAGTSTIVPYHSSVVEQCASYLVAEHQLCCRPGSCTAGASALPTNHLFQMDQASVLDILPCAHFLGVPGAAQRLKATVQPVPQISELGHRIVEEVCIAMKPQLFCRLENRSCEAILGQDYDSTLCWFAHCEKIGVDHHVLPGGEPPDWRNVFVQAEMHNRLLSSQTFGQSEHDRRADFLLFVDDCAEVLHQHPALHSILDLFQPRQQELTFEDILGHFTALRTLLLDERDGSYFDSTQQFIQRASALLLQHECPVQEVTLVAFQADDLALFLMLMEGHLKPHLCVADSELDQNTCLHLCSSGPLLQSLKIQNCHQQIPVLPQIITACTSLTVLDLEGSKMHPHQWVHPLCSLMDQKLLKTLVLSDNQLEGVPHDGWQSFCDRIASCGLRELQLASVGLSYTHLTVLAQMLAAASDPTLRKLDLSHNTELISESQLGCIGALLERSSIEVLKLAGVGLTDATAVSLSRLLPKSRLVELDLQRNHLRVTGALAMVRNVPLGLNILNLDMNTLDRDEMIEVRNEFSNVSENSHIVLETRWYNPDDPHARF